MKTLDFSHNLNLEVITCVGNGLISIDVSQNTKLESLNLGYNLLTSLDVSNNTALVNLYCQDNTNAPLLFICVADKQFAETNFEKDDQAEWVENCKIVNTTEIISTQKTIVKAYDLFGREISIDTKGEILIIIYNTGEVERVFYH